jgi:hypothetical protein
MCAALCTIRVVFSSAFIIMLVGGAQRFTSQEKNVGNSVPNALRTTPIRRAVRLYSLLLFGAVVVAGIDGLSA